MSSRHPLHFLRYFEWALLSLIAVSEVVASFLRPNPHPYTLFHLAVVCGLAIMGTSVPQNRVEKASYLTGEMAVLLITATWGRLRLFPFLCLVVVLRNSRLLNRRQRWVSSGAVFGIYLCSQVYRYQHAAPPRFANDERWGMFILTSTLLFGLVILFLQFLVEAVLTERHSREQLAIANRQLRDYAQRAQEMATLQERNRIAREIHDSLGHSLTVFNLHLEAALRLWEVDPQEAKDLLYEAKDQGKQALQDVRASVRTLRSPPLDGQTLEVAIAALLDDVQRSTGITPQINIDLPQPLPEPIKIAAYRILQEGLTNICKYAQATVIKLSIQSNASLELQLQDNGQGFDVSQNSTGFGLQGMAERARALGGTCRIESRPGHGCRLTVHLPLVNP